MSTEREMMATYNVVDKRYRKSRGALNTISSTTPDGRTHEGGPGFRRDAKSEAFLSATTTFALQGDHYRDGQAIANRMATLIKEIAVDDSGWAWVKDCAPWLRTQSNIRATPVSIAAEAIHARIVAGVHDEDGDRRWLVNAILQRAEEPLEFYMYWTTHFGKNLPASIKRALADSVDRLWDEAAFLRYGNKPGAVTFADLLEIVHPKGTSERQGELYSWILTKARKRKGAVPPASLAHVRARWELARLSPAQRHGFAHRARGFAFERETLDRAMVGQWEFLRSWLGDKPASGYVMPEARQWELAAPRMGYMALLRNLRNFDQAGISDEAAERIAARLTDPNQVKKCKQLPFRFYSAYKEAPSLRWGNALEKALNHCLVNIPELDGRTLFLIDTSDSMRRILSEKSTMNRVTAGALFAFAQALKNPNKADVWGFADGQFLVKGVERGMSLLRSVELFTKRVGAVGHGTQIERAVRDTFDAKRHNRVILFTDCQTFPMGDPRDLPWPHLTGHQGGNVGEAIPAHIPMYAFNLAGHTHGMMATKPNRFEIGGLTDHTFQQIRCLEAGLAGTWPWGAK